MQVKQLNTATFMINHNGFQLSSGLFTATTRACQHLSVRNKQACDILHVRHLHGTFIEKNRICVCFLMVAGCGYTDIPLGQVHNGHERSWQGQREIYHPESCRVVCRIGAVRKVADM